MLIGLIITGEIMNKRGVIAVLRGLWFKEVVYNIKEMGLNRYSISFRWEALMQRAMDDGPWSVMCCCLIIQRQSKEITIEELDLIKVVFWPLIHSLPLEMMTKSNVEIIGG